MSKFLTILISFTCLKRRPLLLSTTAVASHALEILIIDFGALIRRLAYALIDPFS